MSGTRIGGQKAAAAIKAKNPLFYKQIGAKGGANGNTGGFAFPLLCDCEAIEELHKRAMCAGSKGGKMSKRPKMKQKGEVHNV